MKETRTDNDLMQYHYALINKPKIEKTDIQRLLDSYREKFDVDLVFAAERLVDSHMAELTQVSCREQNRPRISKKYFGELIVDESFIRFDEDGLCTYGFPPYDGEEDNAILHYGVFHNGEYIGSVGFLHFEKRRKWNQEERLAVQRLGRVLKSGMFLNRYSKVNTANQEKINQQSHALEAFFATTDCGIIYHTLNGNKILGVNQSALQLLDYSSRGEMERNFNVVAPSVVEKDHAKLRAAIRNLSKAGDRVNVGYQVKHRNGEILDIICRIKLLEQDGQLVCQRVLMDCTEQRLHDKKLLQEKEAQWSEIVSALSSDYNSSFYLDIDSGFGESYRVTENVKRAFPRIIEKQISHQEIQTVYAQRYVHPEDRELFCRETSLETMREKLQAEPFYHVIYRVIEKGRETYFKAKIVRIGNWEKWRGVMVGFSNVDREVRKEMEQKHMMEEALREAEQASQAKTRFLNNMSHDIRTPMNAIIGYTMLAKQHFEKTDQVWDYLQKISTSSDHLLNLINDVLDMSRIESGKFSLEIANCNLRQIMDDLNTVMSGQMQDKKLHFQLDTADIQNEEILCDRLRLNQVLLNILGNAVKYTPDDGKISVRVSQRREGVKEGFAGYQFRIKDNGIGMSEEFQTHLFEQFARERNSTVSGIAGTGLGMAITKRIVDLMGGSIFVQSKQGEGTEFVIDLEFPVPETTAAEPETETPVYEENRPSETRRLLLVEDNLLNQEIATEILSDCGFQVEVANDGSEAVAVIENAEPGYFHAVLMDVQMPVMNGFEATKRIRKLENRLLSGIPIIAMTANAFEEDRREALAAGMNDFVSKPIDVKKLLAALDKICA